MKIEITKTVRHIEVIDVELPYFYRNDLDSEYGYSIIYGKIDEKLHTSIHATKENGIEKYEIEKEAHYSIKHTGLASYFDKEYSSSKTDFEEAKQRCLNFLNQF